MRTPPWRRFTHPDGRAWEIRQQGKLVELAITVDGERFERSRPFDVPVLAARDLAEQVAEQLAEGFTETTPPDWKRRLDELVACWEADDPGFDADVLRAQLLEGGEALAEQGIEKLVGWETGQAHDPAAIRGWLLEHIDAILPVVLLALRYPDLKVQLQVDALLAELKEPGVLEALLSVVEHPTPHLDEAEGGRPANMPRTALLALGKPDADTVSRLAHALEHEDFRVRDLAAAVFAEHADDDLIFNLLWRRRTVARESDGMCWAMLRAAEVRRAPELRDFLLWMQKNARFRTPGYAERIGDALAGLRNR